MNSIPFFVLAALPLLAFAALSPESYQLYECDILKYPQIMYYNDADNALGGKGLPAKTFDECLGLCLSTPQCTAVNWVVGGGQDQLGNQVDFCAAYRNGLSDPDTATEPRFNGDQGPNKYARYPSSTYAKIKKCSEPIAVGCGKQADAYKPKISNLNRIIGGTVAKPHSWPWQVKLITIIKTFPNGSSLISGCGASLVRVNPNKEESDILVTAGHCVCWGETIDSYNPQQYNPAQMTVKAGTHDLEARFELGQQVRKAAVIRKHRDYRYKIENDIAIIKLDKPIKFSDTIRPICLPDATEEIPAGKFCAVAGWGRDKKYDEASSSDVLKQLVLPVHSVETCGSREAWSTGYNAKQMVCAGDLLGNEGMCKGDSGGMLACQQTSTYDPNGGWKLYGAASFVGSESEEMVTCVAKDKPGVFARVSKYRQWIDDNIKELTRVK